MNLLIILAYGALLFILGATGDLLWFILVLPVAALAGVVAAKADEER
jgi:hypothetical protein